MPLPVIANVYLARIKWNSINAPRIAVNDLYFHDDAGGHTGTDVYNAIDAHVTQDMWGTVVSTGQVSIVTTTKLDGSAASVDHSTGNPAKWVGEGTGDAILQGACVVTLRTGFRGRSYRGRIYLPWCSEGAQANGIISGGTVTSMQTAWNTFFAAMKTAGFPIHVVSKLHGTSTEIASLTVQPNTRTQRRRVKH